MIKVAFFGTPEYSLPTLQALLANPDYQVCCVVTQPDRPAGRGQKLHASPIKNEALKHNLPTLQPEKIKGDDEFLAKFKSYGPYDIGVVIAFGQILPTSILNFPKYGSVNLHASILPRWRGAAPIQRAILAGDSTTGVCLMQMEKGLDSGPVYSSLKIVIEPNFNFKILHDKLAALSAELLLRDLNKIISKQLPATPQSEEGTTYATKISENESIINWSNSAAEVDYQIRAFDPIPGSYTVLDGKRLKLFASEIVKNQPQALPGTILKITAQEIIIACLNQAISIKELQLEGKRRMPVAEFLRGFTMLEGTVLGKQ